MNPGDQVIPTIKIGRLHLSDESLIEPTFSIEPGKIGVILRVNANPVMDDFQMPIWTENRFPVQVLFGDKIGWCISHEIQLINESR